MSETTREVFDTLAKVLLFCWVFGLVLQLLLFGAMFSMDDTIHAIHGSVFGMSHHESDLISAGYSGMLKLCVGVFFFVPWLAIRVVLYRNPVTKK